VSSIAQRATEEALREGRILDALNLDFVLVLTADYADGTDNSLL
jgi:hypothetical protein